MEKLTKEAMKYILAFVIVAFVGGIIGGIICNLTVAIIKWMIN